MTGRHLWIVGATRAARGQALPPGFAISVDCHRRRRGPYTGIGDALRTLVPEAIRVDHALVGKHDIEILSLAPELAALVQPSRETLTSLAVPEERTRFYAANRTRRLANGIAEFFLAYATASGRRITVWLDTVHEADPGEQELVAILLRRCRPERVLLAVGSTADALPDQLTAALVEYADRVEVSRSAAEAPQSALPTDDLAAAYVASDGTTDDAEQRLAYEQLGPSRRASMHDARAAELESSPDWSLRLGAIPYHLASGSEPARRGGDALFAAANYCLDMGFYPAVIELASRAREVLDPVADFSRYFAVSTKLTSALAISGRAGEAADVYAELRGRYTHPAVHLYSSYALGMIYTRHHRPEDRDHELARIYLNTAIALASQAEKQRPFHEAFNFNGLALVEMHLGNPQQALELVDKAIAHLDAHIAPNEHLLHRSVLLHNRAQVRLLLGHIDAGVADLNEVIAADPNYPEYYFDRANLRRRHGDTEGALADYARAIELTPPFPELHYNRADLLAELGDVSGAVDEFGYVLELEPEHLDARTNLAALLLDIGETAAASHEVTAGLRHHPGDPHLLCLQGLVRLRSGDPVGARESFTAALSADPTLTAALSNRATIAVEDGDLAAALEDLDRAVALAPSDPDLRYNRAFVLARSGRHADAASDLRASLEHGSNDVDEIERMLAELAPA